MLVSAIHSFKSIKAIHSTLWLLSMLCGALCSKFVRMCTHSLVPIPKTMGIGLGATLVHTGNPVCTAGTVFSKSSGKAHVRKALHSVTLLIGDQVDYLTPSHRRKEAWSKGTQQHTHLAPSHVVLCPPTALATSNFYQTKCNRIAMPTTHDG